ncbi:uncharacterized protein TRIADDRAFT_59883 [Trichoplax adhaerens]|uniref:Cleavage/polyadenylation specificity factor A subunit C-terminal domain-containing protein n=1 Tax=Trichoplax adhaerens TaxID=10228 RepID=B3S6P9_TRIAD|nr:hypothetical protein TRIADDRAFT_59883 [Trichoplax adhaerens]EDV21798.1 hypothetical protein TRIADDRAFT_59883 [Trichoplax adhaerens]|eukprot:XP_002115946.1 hypothetical protein TRIADDRAFT_59883 [Trichoplax adhaerens]
MYACYKESYPPTAVNHCLACHFYSSDRLNLLTAGPTCIRVYDIIKDQEDIDLDNRSDNADNHLNKDNKLHPELEFLASYSFYGKIYGIESVRFRHHHRDSLFICFADAKLSLVEYDADNSNLTTLSLHTFEDDELKNGFSRNLSIPIIRVDPDNRCAAMVVSNVHLAILPFRHRGPAEQQVQIDPKNTSGKYPLMPSYVVDVRDLGNEKVSRLIDIRFLEGYYEPTILILCEILRTWSGRVAVRQDTCSILAVSLNTIDKVHPVIWSLNNLPFDCLGAITVPRPIGGVLIFAANCLLHLNQSKPPYAESLNSITDESTTFPMHDADLAPNTPETQDTDEPTSKKLRTDDEKEDEELEKLYSAHTSCTAKESYLRSYTFEVCDRILHVGPCASIAIGQISTFVQEESDVEVVICSGHDKNGALSVLNKGIKPQVVASYDLPGCVDMWTVKDIRLNDENDGDFETENTHKFLIISRDNLTMILRTGKEITEVEQLGFLTQTKTVFAGNLDNGNCIIQVTPYEVILVSKGEKIQQLELENESPIVFCSLQDPYISLLLEGGSIMMLAFELSDNGEKQVKLVNTTPLNHSRIAACCLFQDNNGRMSVSDGISIRTPSPTNEPAELMEDEKFTIDDDELLYLDVNDTNLQTNDVPVASTSYTDNLERKVSYWLFLCLDNGKLEVYSIPSYDKVYTVNGFALAPLILAATSDDEDSYSNTDGVRSTGNMPHVNEILVVGMGYEQRKILIVVPHEIQLTETRAPAGGSMGLSTLVDGYVKCFAPFNIANCPNGFLYFNSEEDLRICVLDQRFTYDCPWPVHKVPLRNTLHFITHHFVTKTYVIISSTMTVCEKMPHITTEDKEFIPVEKGDRFIHAPVEKFCLQLITSETWEIIPDAEIQMAEWEHVTCLKSVKLKSEETVSGLKEFIAVGTTNVCGEEVACRGRIVIFDVIEVVPEPGKPLTKNKIKTYYDKEQKGPVTAITCVEGFLVTSIGQKIYIWEFRDNKDLIGMAFIDTLIYIHSLDRHQLEIFNTNFYVNKNQLGFVAPESHGGQFLVRRAEIQTGSNAHAFFRTKVRALNQRQNENKHITWFGTLDGSIGLLLPVDEKEYRRLFSLQAKLSIYLEQNAGLNQKAFRTFRSHQKKLQNSMRNILDGDLLKRYFHLGFVERRDLAKQIMSTPEQIINDLTKLELSTI